MLTSMLRIFLTFWNLYSKFSANHMQTDSATKDIQHCIWCILSLKHTHSHTHKQTIIFIIWMIAVKSGFIKTTDY